MKKTKDIAMLLYVVLASGCATAQNYPALIPYPKQLKWTPGKLYLKAVKSIIIQSKDLYVEAVNVQQVLAGKGIKVPIKIAPYTNEPGVIALQKNQHADKTFPNYKEAYKITINSNTASLAANTLHGIFNSIQTLKQIIADKDFIQGCEITDYPVYTWRGYMIDVARHYYSINMIKQQVDVMTAYKLNVLHMHLTDNEAWRLEIKKYPQLTAPEFMTRDKGQSYSIQEIKELIEYCRKRYITLVPEIDMPGHSEAFTKAMGVDMQSEAGLKIVKEIIQEICDTYDVPYFHIGADEVDIKNSQFIPVVTKQIRQNNKKVIAWIPGGRSDNKVIGQWWDGKLNRTERETQKFIDSWYLYINHFDPESSVTNVLFRQIGNQVAVDSSFLGGELCSWPDRAVRDERSILWQNPIYPALVAFSERVWKGGGYTGVFADIGPDSSRRAKEFFEFEKRLIDHKFLYFKNLPFPYVRQSQIKWKLLGPFANNGNLANSFWPENKNTSPSDSSAVLNVTGATIWLRHWWANDVHSWLPDPHENTTWYGYTSFKSESDTTFDFWIGFKDISRSHGDASPPPGNWDYQQSKVWLNGQPVSPPKWANAGKKGNHETPLIDEGFAYRIPLKLAVRKGWNQILVKCPVGGFQAENGNEAVKWMFTMVPVHRENGINLYVDDVPFCTN